MASPIPFILTADPVKLRGDNVFRILFQVAKGLHQRANKCKEQEEKHGFSNLASRVEEFLLRCLDALNDDVYVRKEFLNNYYDETKVLVETEVEFKRKKVILQNWGKCSAISYQWQFTDKIYRPFISRKNGARGRTIRKVMERGGGAGEFSSSRNFFRYQIACMNFV